MSIHSLTAGIAPIYLRGVCFLIFLVHNNNYGDLLGLAIKHEGRGNFADASASSINFFHSSVSVSLKQESFTEMILKDEQEHN